MVAASFHREELMHILLGIVTAAVIGSTAASRDTSASCVATPVTGAFRTVLKTGNGAVPALVVIE